MVDETEGVTPGGLLFQILLQAIARDGCNLERTEIGEDVFVDAIAGGRGSGKLPMAAAEGKKAIANPIGESPEPQPWENLTGMGIDGLEQFRHFGQRFGAGHFGTRTENLASAVVVVPPEGDPVQATTGFAFLEAATLKASASRGYRFRDSRDLVHRSRR